MPEPAGSLHPAVIQLHHPTDPVLAPPRAAPFVRSEPGSWELQGDLTASYGTKAIPGGVEGLKSDFS